jgi:hypothetical protein
MALTIDKCSLPSSEANRYSEQQFLAAIHDQNKDIIALLGTISATLTAQTAVLETIADNTAPASP